MNELVLLSSILLSTVLPSIICRCLSSLFWLGASFFPHFVDNQRLAVFSCVYKLHMCICVSLVLFFILFFCVLYLFRKQEKKLSFLLHPAFMSFEKRCFFIMSFFPVVFFLSKITIDCLMSLSLLVSCNNNNRSETAILYNDRAVLENYHVSSAFRIILDDDANILANLSKEEYREFRNLVIEMVLATDMSSHFQQIKTMKSLLNHADLNVDKSAAMSLILHCCDISHPAKLFDIHQRWTYLLMEEFFRQGDTEKSLGLPYSPLCDRNTTHIAESQIGKDLCDEILVQVLFLSNYCWLDNWLITEDSHHESTRERERQEKKP